MCGFEEITCGLILRFYGRDFTRWSKKSKKYEREVDIYCLHLIGLFCFIISDNVGNLRLRTIEKHQVQEARVDLGSEVLEITF